MTRLLVATTLSLLLAGQAHGQLITAHRGASHDAPENTLAAFRLASTVKECGADGVGMQGQRKVIDEGFVERLAAGGVREFHVWTVDSPEDALAFHKLGAIGITTNRPAFIRAALEEATP